WGGPAGGGAAPPRTGRAARGGPGPLPAAGRPLQGDGNGEGHRHGGARHEPGARRMTAVTLMVLAKAPVPGRVKTRFCPPCTPEQAAVLAEAALADTLATVAATPVDRRPPLLDGEAGPWLPAGIDVGAQARGGLDGRRTAAFARGGAPALPTATAPAPWP